MSDELLQAVQPDKPAKRRRWFPCFRFPWMIVALLIGGLVLRAVWLFWLRDASHSIEIGPETTFIVEPRTPDGFVDFTAAINVRRSHGVTPENNAVVLFMQAYGPDVIPADQRARYFNLLGIPQLPEEGEYLIRERDFLQLNGAADDGITAKIDWLKEDLAAARTRPWNESEFPHLARLLAINERPLQYIVEATRRDRCFSPIATPDEQDLFAPFRIEQQHWLAAQLLTLRGMRRLDAGDFAGAWEEILTCYKLGRLNTEPPDLSAFLTGSGIDEIATVAAHVMIKDRRLRVEQARQCLADLDEMPAIPETGEMIDFDQRLAIVKRCCEIPRGRVPLSAKDRLLDWNAVLRHVNQLIDENVDIARIADPREMKSAFEAAQTGAWPYNPGWLTLFAAFLGGSSESSLEHKRALNLMQWGVMFQLRSAQMTTEARAELTRLGFALAVQRLEQGAFPESLAELAPGILAVVPRDPCSGEEFVYRPSDGGFVLYSVGENLRDDGGATFEDEPHGDDLVLRVSGE